MLTGKKDNHDIFIMFNMNTKEILNYIKLDGKDIFDATVSPDGTFLNQNNQEVADKINKIIKSKLELYANIKQVAMPIKTDMANNND